MLMNKICSILSRNKKGYKVNDCCQEINSSYWSNEAIYSLIYPTRSWVKSKENTRKR